MIKRIVLTGGPCAGKTSVLPKIEQELTELGYKVLIVSESATELINSGIKPFGNNPLSMVEFQKLIMLYQYQKEQLYSKATNLLEGDTIIIYDRGLLDNKAYITQKQFKEVMKYLSDQENIKVTEEDILERYDMVIHLVTTAQGASEYYTKENNSARKENIEEAKELDQKIINAWINHPNLKIIDNEKKFTDKMEKVLKCIHQLLDNPYQNRTQLKYLVEVEETTLNKIKKEITPIYIEQIYLENEYYEERIRKATKEGETFYYYTKQIKKENGDSEVLLNKRITENEYNLIKNNYKISNVITKTRYTFIQNKQYYRLDEYQDDYVLEIELTDKTKNPSIPLGIIIKKDIVKQRKRITSKI